MFFIAFAHGTMIYFSYFENIHDSRNGNFLEVCQGRVGIRHFDWLLTPGGNEHCKHAFDRARTSSMERIFENIGLENTKLWLMASDLFTS